MTESWCIFIISCSFVVHTVHLKGFHRLFCYINDSCSSVLSWTLLAHWHQLTAHESDLGECENRLKKKKEDEPLLVTELKFLMNLHYKTGNMFIDPRFAFESSLAAETELSYLSEPEKMETWRVWGSRNCGWSLGIELLRYVLYYKDRIIRSCFNHEIISQYLTNIKNHQNWIKDLQEKATNVNFPDRKWKYWDQNFEWLYLFTWSWSLCDVVRKILKHYLIHHRFQYKFPSVAKYLNEVWWLHSSAFQETVYTQVTAKTFCCDVWFPSDRPVKGLD